MSPHEDAYEISFSSIAGHDAALIFGIQAAPIAFSAPCRLGYLVSHISEYDGAHVCRYWSVSTRILTAKVGAADIDAIDITSFFIIRLP